MEVVREVLRAIQDKPNRKPQKLVVEGVDDVTVAHHLSLLHQAGFVDAHVKEIINRPEMPHILVVDLTWNGHEFAGALLVDDNVWQKIKSAFRPDQLAQIPLTVVKEVALKAATAWAIARLGLGG